MAVAKVIYKSSANATPETWMDVTHDTVEADKLLASYTATKNDGTSITGSYSAPFLQSKTVTPTTSTQSILPDSGFGGMSQVTVNAIPSAYLIPSGTLSITSNASGIDVGSYASVDVNVAGGKVYTAYLDYNPTYDPTDEDFYKAKVTLNNVVYDQYHREAGTSFTFSPGEILHCYAWDDDGVTASITVDGIAVGTSQGKSKVYDYELPDHDLTIRLVAAKCYITERLPNEDAIVMQTISGTYENSRVTKVGSYAFTWCNSLNTVNFANCTYIEQYAFTSCSNLNTISFPNCSVIGECAFDRCFILSYAEFPVCSRIASYAFRYCSALSYATFPSCVSISGQAFMWCNNLSSIYFPKCKSIFSSAFAFCSKLPSVFFPSCTTVGGSAFAYCSLLSNISFPKAQYLAMSCFYSCAISSAAFAGVSYIGNGAFLWCSNLNTLLFRSGYSSNGTIYPYAFKSCYNLLSLYLLESNVYKLSNITAFDSTPMRGYTDSTGGIQGSIFVPASLYDAYVSSTNWTDISSCFVSMTNQEIYEAFPVSVNMSATIDSYNINRSGTGLLLVDGVFVENMSYYASITYYRISKDTIFSYNGNFTWSGFNSTFLELSNDSGVSLRMGFESYGTIYTFQEWFGDPYSIVITTVS